MGSEKMPPQKRKPLMLIDRHGRTVDYLRLAVTDRCNLRCFYCMPESGIHFVQRKELLSYEEMLRLLRVFGEEGVSKVRITGGEPFLRKGIMDFLEELTQIKAIQEVNITTNGTFTEDKIEQLEHMGIRSINLSIDSLDKERFHQITRRNAFDKVMGTLDALRQSSIKVKINMVVMDGQNIEDIYPMLALTKERNLSVRFIEEMPFNGSPQQGNSSFWPMAKILEHIQTEHTIEKLPDPLSSTSSNYQIPGFVGSFGIIAAYTRSFCGSCNRIRLTPQGDLKTCLYEHGGTNFRDLLRAGATDEQLVKHLKQTLLLKAKDGFEAEAKRQTDSPVSESMATIGG